VALSHCWGGSTPVMTTIANIDKFRNRIPPPLPKTFADAVEVTRALGIQYLWIDSLCIIQDSPGDWSNEASLMASVYSSAYVTIAADAASNSSQGFLNHSNRQLSAAVPVTYEGVTEHSQIWVRERGGLGYQLPFHDWADQESPFARGKEPSFSEDKEEVMKVLNKVCRAGENPKSRLSTRGWVFQERALSPRTLHFGQSEVGWECQSLISCECSASSLRYRRTTSLLKQARATMAWTNVLEEYTRLNLTVPEDRLTALSGLAEVRHSPTKDQYIAGMWRENLKHQLLWKALLKYPALKSYIAPSWSWASVTGAILYPRQWPDIGTWKILDIKCRPKVKNMFGDCDPGAYLVIEGPLVLVKLFKNYAGWRVKPKKGKETEGPQLTPNWDSEDRRRFADENENGVTYSFLMAGLPPAPPQGLLLKACNPSGAVEVRQKIPRISGPAAANSTSEYEPQLLQSYERLAYVCAEGPIQKRSWSDESDASEKEVYRDGYHWRVWKKLVEQQVFAVY
jgi:Heterokaryon incompatibility protein (HET)